MEGVEFNLFRKVTCRNFLKFFILFSVFFSLKDE